MSKFILLLVLPLLAFSQSYESTLLELESQLFEAIKNSFRERGYNPSSIYNSQPLHDGWRQSWLGIFYQSSSNWIYHYKLGWLYPSESGDGYWLYSDSYEWLWSNSSAFPYFYSPDFGWLYFYVDHEYFYAFEKGKIHNFSVN